MSAFFRARRALAAAAALTFVSRAGAQPAPPRPASPPVFPPPALTLAALPADAPEVGPNDNTRPAGRLADGVLRVALEARAGVWRPEVQHGPSLPVAAFAEVGAPPTTPGPLLRVPAGTEVRATVRNALPMPITVHGLGDGRGVGGAGTTIAPGATHEFRFRADAPGSSYYVARTGPTRTLGRLHDDSQLHGVLVVDSTRGAPPRDRVFVISNWYTRDTTTVSGLGPGATLAINGRSWPHTERLALRMGDTARWRVVNASSMPHPMHLHGAYFRVDARGDGARDTAYAPEARRLAVTETLAAGETMALAWTPVHPGNWLFHCHLASHVAPRAAFEGAAHVHTPHDPLAHMSALVLGVTVSGAAPDRPARRRALAEAPARPLRLVARSRPAVYGPHAGFGYALGDEAPDAPLRAPGPLLELVRGERVAVTVVNRTPEPTAVHWHGLEIESIADGVPGWSGAGAHVTPMIAPGDSLTVRFTPPRAGTFMYHAHANEMRQLSSGLYGALVVREPGAPRDPSADHVLVVSDAGPLVGFFGASPAVLVNGSTRPPALRLAAGRTHRLRLVNIRTEAMTTLALADGDGPATWRVVAKDGADLPAARAGGRPASLRFAPGETVDVEVAPRAGQALTLRWESRPGGPATSGALTLEVVP
jgi:FtsP/CotA-like multicopper oxidase with cupredoxin domain